ncbi:hypothetical protein [Thalassomonas haliotis]|uniref:Tse2 ADP-ribosyltransferase toxin domain-containing protein n=1 Tax=Thalassomonas haliotis TaxID=485448 RepID=A0ABY7VAY0_9GAMM|nr:hypothetical protein [Thalassomonas haliotis]WDE10390.1 hypothetical protein H3N35_19230 [Thalassomonas haliotis]
MHTPIKFYVKLPADLFRGGTPTKHKFDYLRTMPPRREDQTYDVKINPKSGFIDHTTGGLSLFNTPNYVFGQDWWVIPAGTRLPPEFTLSKDLTGEQFRGHYTIRALIDMPGVMWKKKLTEWADEHAIHINQYRKVNKDV